MRERRKEERVKEINPQYNNLLCIYYCRKPSTMALSLDDKLLGEKVDNYCSSSEDEEEDEDEDEEGEGERGGRRRVSKKLTHSIILFCSFIIVENHFKMALSLDDKLLGEKVDNYCSSSEDEVREDEEEGGGRGGGERRKEERIKEINPQCIYYCRKHSTMALSLDDKLLGEKVDNYCSSSEDDHEDEDEDRGRKSSQPKQPTFIPEEAMKEYDGHCTNVRFPLGFFCFLSFFFLF